MIRRKPMLLLLAAVVLAGTVFWLLQSQHRGESRYRPPDGASPLFTAFYRFFMDESGGVYTNVRNDLPKVPGTASGHQMLSESTGLLMLYALQKHDRFLFDRQKAFLERRLMAGNGLIRWMVDPDNRSNDARSNASIDDLRVIAALRQADREWGGGGSSYGRESSRIASALWKFNVREGYLTDYYDWRTGEPSDTVTISYLDLRTLALLAETDERWKAVLATSRNLLQQGSLPNGLFRKTYDLKNGTWDEPRDVHLVDTLYCAYHMAEAGMDVQSTISFIVGQMKEKGRLYGRFLPNGQALGEVESPAVYAMAVRFLEKANGNPDTVRSLRKRLAELAVSDPASPYFGGYIQLPSLEGYSFDHLQALLAE